MRNDLGLISAEEEEERRRGVTTLLDLLTEKMDGVDRRRGRWESLKERLGLKRMRCCGPAAWTYRSSPSSSPDRSSGQDDVVEVRFRYDEEVEAGTEIGSVEAVQNCVLSPAGMSLATALAAERQFRLEAGRDEEAEVVGASGVATPSTPRRVSLMRLLAETMDGVDEERERGRAGIDKMCCVCMERKKGAAFIPCGHTFCRVCSRELWLDRGTCPLCNRLILEVLDIF